jgi:hypothetical protein
MSATDREITKGTHNLSELWELACAWDHVAPDSKFVIWSGDNPWAKKYNFAMGCFLKSRDVRAAGDLFEGVL